MVKIPKLVRTLRIIKLFKLSSLLENLKLDQQWRFEFKVRENLFKTLYISLLTFLVVHIAACIFAAIGQIDYFGQQTWIYHQNLQDSSSAEIYLDSVYYCFVVLTTVGYGDIYSQNVLERAFSLVWMLFGIGFYSFTIGFITEFFTSKESRKTLLAKKIKRIEKFAKDKKIDESLLHLIKKSLVFSSKKICYRWLDGNLNIIKDMS